MSKKLDFIINEEKKPNSYDLNIVLVDQLRRSNLINIMQFLILITLLTFCVFLSVRNRHIPFIVEVNKSTGEVLNSQKITEIKLNTENLSERQISYFLSNFIANTRTVTFDKQLYQKNINQSSFFLTRESQKQLENSLKENDVLEKINKGISVNVQIKNFNKIDENKYQVTWEEDYLIPNGAATKESFLGIFIISTVPVKNQQMILNNPLGLVITQMSISKTN